MIPAGLLIILIGLLVGSFLNVCIYRLPRHLSIVSPGSACPGCATPIRFYDNIPLISYILLRGRCRKCGARISGRYPLVEALNGLLYWSALSTFGIGWHLPLVCAFVSAMIVITFIDLDFQIIPDVVTLPGIGIGVLGAWLVLPDPFLSGGGAAIMQFSGVSHASPVLGPIQSVIGAVTGFCLFYAIAFVGSMIARTDALGGGDIKMMAMVGAFTGWKGVLLTTFIGSLVGSVIGVVLMLRRGMDRKARIPFGPFLAAGAVISLLYGGIIVNWYLGLLL